MRKVTTINLNNNAYQIDEEGYDALRDYLSAAERNLEGNPDRAEILADLEQAIGDKCRACLGAHKTVVSVDDIRRILAEMGPVEGSASAAAGAAPGATPGTGSTGPAGYPFPRRMYRLSENRMWAGVCSGLGAYFGVDAVWVRVLFVLLTIFTGGVWILIYIAMCFIVPMAETAEERAAAYGAPFNANELINRVKKNSSEFRFRGPRMSRGPRMGRGPSWWAPHAGVNGATSSASVPAPGYAARVTGGILLPVLTVLSAVWFATMLVGGIAFWHMHMTFGDGQWPHGHHGWASGPPHWVAIVALIAIWALIAMPLGAGRRAALYYANGGRPHGWADAWAGLLWFAMVCALIYFAWQFLPGAQDALRNLLNVTGLNTTLV
jgi:phage shock protein PspC (stress-responsive transcriptional regulator)